MSKETHWAEGNKFALETAKTIFLLSNGVPVAILAVFKSQGSSMNEIPILLKFGLVFFVLSAVGAIAMMSLGYLTNLHYGNAEALQGSEHSGRQWQIAQRFHNWTYASTALALGGVLGGLAVLVYYMIFCL